MSGAKKGGWLDRFVANREAAQKSPQDLDVVFIGDSIVMRWTRLHKSDFGRLFDKTKGGEFQGLTLGLVGDSAPELLWRIQNGEVPPNLNPKVFWVVVGTNDIGHNDFFKKDKKESFCSEEVVVPGILQVLKELRRIRPDATIVINSVLPRSNQDGCALFYDAPVEKDLWPPIQVINEKLRQFSETDEKIEYFDASDVFTAGGEGEAPLYIRAELMGDCLHPSQSGYKAFGKVITEKLHKLLG